MKALFFSLFLFLPMASSFAADAGGVGSGGGGTILLPGVSEGELKTAIAKSSSPILAWLSGQEIWSRTGRGNRAYTKIFHVSMPSDPVPDAENIYGVLNDLQIEYRTDESCFDANGKEVDGSIYTSLNNPHAICLSGKRLLAKLQQDNYQAQVAALIVHEVSHLMGTTEDEAVSLQADAVRAIRLYNFEDGFGPASRLRTEMEDLEERTQAALDKSNKAAGLYEDRLNDALNSIGTHLHYATIDLNYTQAPNPILSAWRYDTIDRIHSLDAVIQNLTYATCVKCASAYERTFRGARELYASAFYRMAARELGPSESQWPTHNQFVDLLIPNIQNTAQLSAALAELKTEFANLREALSFPADFNLTER